MREPSKWMDEWVGTGHNEWVGHSEWVGHNEWVGTGHSEWVGIGHNYIVSSDTRYVPSESCGRTLPPSSTQHSVTYIKKVIEDSSTLDETTRFLAVHAHFSITVCLSVRFEQQRQTPVR